MPQPVVDAIYAHLDLELHTGGYEAAALKADAIQHFYEAVASLLNAKPSNIAYATNATDAYFQALSSVPFERGDKIITTQDDYVSNQIAFLQLRKRFGVEVMWAKVTDEGGVDVADMHQLIQKHQPKLVAVTHVPTSSGLVQPVAEIGKFCREREILYLVDACQAAGQLPLDVEAIGCDFLSATFRKFIRGPRGAGFLFVSDRVLKSNVEPLFLDLHGASWTSPETYELQPTASRFEVWERSYALLLGSAAATDYALQLGLENIAQRVQALAHYTRQQLATLPNTQVLDRGNQLCGIVTFHVHGRQPEVLKKQLRERHINVSITTIDSARFDFSQKGVTWALRASPHYYNIEEEIDTLVATLGELLST